MTCTGARLGRYSFGVGDRFAHQAAAQLRAFVRAAEKGLQVTPVWNKSNREHAVVGSQPASVRAAADAAVQALRWRGPYFVDADHIGLATVDRYVAPCDFFTLDVAGAIGRPAASEAVDRFVARHPELVGRVEIPGIETPLELTHDEVARATAHYLHAVGEAGTLYRTVLAQKGEGAFVTEVSMDEADSPQTPAELLVILAAMADQRIPAQTIAPRFTGRFNKGVDYVGDVGSFEREFSDDVAVIGYAVTAYGLPEGLKLSVHSGSDKFALFPPIRRVMQASGAGVHVKTSGTTWLEEIIGLAEAGGDGLQLAKDVYAGAYEEREELCAPYASVIDIDAARLPDPSEVRGWNARQFAATVRHDQSEPEFDPNVRQLIHVGYGIAASMGARYTELLRACEETIARNVELNLYERHLKPLFLDA